MEAKQKEALAKWSAAGLHEVTLPTLTRVKIRIPEPEALLRDEALPADLRTIALQFATTSVDTKNLTDEGMQTFMNLSRQLAARSVRAILIDDEWIDLRLDAESYRELELPPEDLDAIEAIALRRLTPRQVTTGSLTRAGLATQEEKKQVDAEEAGSTVSGFGNFREEPERAADGADGGKVRAKSGSRLHRDNGPSTGAAAG